MRKTMRCMLETAVYLQIGLYMPPEMRHAEPEVRLLLFLLEMCKTMREAVHDLPETLRTVREAGMRDLQKGRPGQ